MEVPDCEFGDNGLFVFADCAVNTDLDSEKLAEVAGLSAVNGHVALPGKRTAFISATGASEYLTNEANIYNGKIYSTYYKDGAGKYGTYGAEIPLWDAKIAGDVDAIKAAFDSLN